MVQVVSRVLRASVCTNCRLSLLRTFTATSDLPNHTARIASRSERSRAFPQRRFSSTSTTDNSVPVIRLEQDASRSIREDGILGDAKAAEQHEILEDIEAITDTSDSVPWYLQVDSPTRLEKPLSERQRIPELPELPPAILEPLLNQISVDLGMDDLTILDLRDLDPPPALGANLLMIIGTARSEKHLHVSADRLCRWLRSNYKLRPEADGLLGRNELKLKLKRKARRAKLVGNTTEEEDTDDGVRTGWVCVNVGTVEGPTNTRVPENAIKGFVGFGRQSEGVKVVVQMLVEEKRQEIDLERLWTGISKRQSLSDISEETADDLVTVLAHSTTNNPAASSASKFAPPSAQSRGYHTSARLSSLTLQDATANPSMMPILRRVQGLPNSILSAIETGDYSTAKRLLLDDRDTIPELKGDRWRPYLLQCLKNHLENLSPDLALKELGSDHNDRTSTRFLLCFYQNLSRYPGLAEWEFHIWLFCRARSLGHAGYGPASLYQLMTKMQLSGCQIRVATWLSVLRSILQRSDMTAPPEPEVLRCVMLLLQEMQSHGNNLMAEEIWVTLQEAIAVYPRTDISFESLETVAGASLKTFYLPVRPVSPLHQQLNSVMLGLNVPIETEEGRVRLLTVFAKQYDWVSFWAFWRSFAQRGQSRSSALYACMFRLVAEFGHQKGCMTVLRTWIVDMDVEEPEVRLDGEVRKAVEACLKIADPTSSGNSAENPDSKGEWVNLWRRCNAASF